MAPTSQLVTQKFTIYYPEHEFEVTVDCRRLKALPVKHLHPEPPGQVGFELDVRRVTRECAPPGGKAKDDWCTQEVFRVFVKRSIKSDLDGSLKPEHVHVGDVVCECHCAKVTSMTPMSLYWITNKGPATEWWNVWDVDEKSERHNTHFRLSWRDAQGEHVEEWDATVVVASTGYIAISGFISIEVPASALASRRDLIAAAGTRSGFNFEVS
jgi:hypothetical protein